ncbi:M14 family zinc carboxypeptidase [Kribbella sp. NPDC056345]|uniref:M14 family zinc carboxypeptidase n=1 Tax=Kribbella sp. NPDC056345 TaxID=3345789 RepID=UPI0035DE7872
MNWTKRRGTAVVGCAAAVAAVVAGLQGLTAPAQADPPPDNRSQLLDVSTPTRADKEKLLKLGFDVTEQADADSVTVFAGDARERSLLKSAGFAWTVKVADVEEQNRLDRAKDAEYAAKTAVSPLPSGRDTYRRLADYEADLTLLAKKYPRLVKPITLPYKTGEGRTVRGVEITTNPQNVSDGKPVFLLIGAHHAREWPSAETAIEYAFDLTKNYGKNKRITSIVQSTRTIVVPLINVDGYNTSREAAPKGDFSKFDYEMKRKTCEVTAKTLPEELGGDCGNNPQGVQRGTDPNRNYPGFWGGPGASTNYRSETYRGDEPSILPEVRNVRWVVSNRQVTGLVTLHTFGNLILRPPGVMAVGAPPDEPAYKALGASLAADNGYTNQPSYQLYDTTGSTEDWSYWATGGFGFTFEIGSSFHPPYAEGVVAHYVGQAPAPGVGTGGNREALLTMSEATGNAKLHSTLLGATTPGRTLKIAKTFQTPTSPVVQPDGTKKDPIIYTDKLESTLTTGLGPFKWSVNPSTRPYVAGRWGRDPVAPTQPSVTLTNPDGIPVKGQSETATFTIKAPPEADNGKATIKIGWNKPDVDWDVYIYGPDGKRVAQAASLADPEVAVLLDPVPGQYTVQVENFDGGETADWTGSVEFAPPTPASYTGVKESWKLSCYTKGGKLLGTRDVTVDRGKTVWVGDPCRRFKG